MENDEDGKSESKESVLGSSNEMSVRREEKGFTFKKFPGF